MFKLTGMISEKDHYAVGDGFGKYTHFFPLGVTNISVTEDMVYANFFNWRVKFTLPKGVNPIDFYQDMHSLDVYEPSVSINVH